MCWTRWRTGEVGNKMIGSGACGLPAAIRAADQGASVIVVEANYDIGGHGILNGGNVPLGGGTSAQKKYGIADSPDILFRDLTDWSVVETNGMPEYRYNDRAVQRGLADNEAGAYEFLLENGVTFEDGAPNVEGGHAVGISAPRANRARWTKGQSLESPSGGGGTAIYRPLENSAKKKGVRFLLNYHMDVLVRETPTSGRVLGIRASYTPKLLPGSTTPMRPFRSDGVIALTAKDVSVKAKKAVIVATGGSSSNVNFRRMFDGRLTEVYQVAGEPYSAQDASGELAGMAVGAALWGTANQTMERSGAVRKRAMIGAQYIYPVFTPQSPVFPLVRATGLRIGDWQNVILVKENGRRFYSELDSTYSGYFAHAMAWSGDPAKLNGGGPVWAIFDSAAVQREQWKTEPPFVDREGGYFFSGDTLEEVAGQLQRNPHQWRPMPGRVLRETVERFNSFVDTGVDLDFKRRRPPYKIETPPFYAAWATPCLHDSLTGIRINTKCQVLDIHGQVIPGLYSAGEAAGGFALHGLARCTVFGRIAGMEAAKG